MLTGQHYPHPGSEKQQNSRRVLRNEASRRWRRARREKEIEVVESVKGLEKDIKVLEKEIEVYEKRVVYLEGILFYTHHLYEYHEAQILPEIKQDPRFYHFYMLFFS